MKDFIDSDDYRFQTDSLIKSMENAIDAIDTNFVKLFTTVVARMNAAAESDD
ncbi:MAG: hypothetical protein OSJ70_07990 [Bacilli bacterium]|nr:hypothetical protein [Bacilli bacterium]